MNATTSLEHRKRYTHRNGNESPSKADPLQLVFFLLQFSLAFLPLQDEQLPSQSGLRKAIEHPSVSIR